MAQVTITSTTLDFAHQIESVHGHRLISDEPESLGGRNAGMSPFELYLSALASCTAITLRMYAQKKGWELGMLHAELVSRRDADGHLQVHRTLHADGALDDAQWARLLDVVERTPVTLVMKQGATITSSRG